MIRCSASRPFLADQSLIYCGLCVETAPDHYSYDDEVVDELLHLAKNG